MIANNIANIPTGAKYEIFSIATNNDATSVISYTLDRVTAIIGGASVGSSGNGILGITNLSGYEKGGQTVVVTGDATNKTISFATEKGNGLFARKGFVIVFINDPSADVLF